MTGREISVQYCARRYRVTFAYDGEPNPFAEVECMSHTAGKSRSRNYWRTLTPTANGIYRAVVLRARATLPNTVAA